MKYGWITVCEKMSYQVAFESISGSGKSHHVWKDNLFKMF